MRNHHRPLSLLLSGSIISCAAAIPLVYILYHALSADSELWLQITSGQYPDLIVDTLLLVFSVISTTAVVGILAAWLVERTELKQKGAWRLVLSLPLAIPGYIVAICYMFLLRRGGFVDQVAMNLSGFGRNEFPLPPLFNLGGVSFIMSLYAFPLVFLSVSGALRAQDGTLEDAIRLSGHSRIYSFFRVNLPLLMPAILGGLILVGLYVFSDFGTVSLMRYQTFTTAIFREFAGVINRSATSITSMGLLILMLPLLISQNFVQQKRYTRSSNWRVAKLVSLGVWKLPAMMFLGLLVLLSLLIPLLVLSGLTLQGIIAPTAIDKIWRVSSVSFFDSGWKSLILSILAATLAVALALVPSVLIVRHRSKFSLFLSCLGKSAFALPGIMVGLGFLMFFIVTPIYATLLSLVLALAFRLLPQTLTLSESALRYVSPNLEQASLTAGYGYRETILKITVPLAAPGLLATWSLAFVTAMKELPLLMILRPPGFDTLPIKIWEAANDSFYTQAAPPALFLIALTLCTLAFVHRLGRFGINKIEGYSERNPGVQE